MSDWPSKPLKTLEDTETNLKQKTKENQTTKRSEVGFHTEYELTEVAEVIKVFVKRGTIPFWQRVIFNYSV